MRRPGGAPGRRRNGGSASSASRTETDSCACTVTCSRAASTPRSGTSSASETSRDLVEHALLGIGGLAPERVLGVTAGPPVRLVDVPRHRIPGPGRTHPRAAVLLEEDQPVLAAAHEVPLVRRQVEREHGLGALPDRRRLVAPEAGEAVVELIDVAP